MKTHTETRYQGFIQEFDQAKAALSRFDVHAIQEYVDSAVLFSHEFFKSMKKECNTKQLESWRVSHVQRMCEHPLVKYFNERRKFSVKATPVNPHIFKLGESDDFYVDSKAEGPEDPAKYLLRPGAILRVSDDSSYFQALMFNDYPDNAPGQGEVFSTMEKYQDMLQWFLFQFLKKRKGE